ncbi:nucleotidyltransferase [Longimicrobium terrae]|uniref:Cyclic GMP-AMP synthase n=1 Tax=Longimicrobium terrae TaxID=1639882 RepID=A0A841GWW0_9BACT|nr:nucleotidyltransferase [Longimicrobium terrae]MBB4635967.1 hypothetical protein [Longimicrobium terrae]MBB6070363.1 hypothetical protein [Longimicrobium terrae]NNC30860.1 nucleotidyltransferase [Longimicrobium terrae]
MANVQKQFEEFDGKIRLGRFDENATLREKRDIIRRKLDRKLPDVFKDHGEECPEYFYRDQGSYDVGTGVKPLDSDYDIDQGLYFEVSTGEWDPVILKKRVWKALDGHTDEVRIRRPCVTVQYHEAGEPVYHVDIAVYANANGDGKARLAVGRESTPTEKRKWELSHPKALKEKIRERFPDADDRKQFRRAVRALKRWKDKKFSSDGNAAPLGIGLTVLVYDDLQATYSDIFARTPDDLQTLRKLVEAVLGRFKPVWDAEEEKLMRRLTATLPVEPFNDVFEQMSNKQMETFEDKLKRLKEALDFASDAVDPHDACKELRKQFGDDFPVPEKQETARYHAPAIATSASSA